MSEVIAFDVGGSRIKAGVVQEGMVSSLLVADTDERDGAAGVLRSIVCLGRRLISDHVVTASGVSVRGIVDPERGTLLDVNEPLRSLIGQPLAALLANELGCPVFMENDARMYALGELMHGAGRGRRNMVCLTLGTGIGCGVAIGGRVLRGERGVSGILGGHLTVDINGPRCTCGNIGCLEALIGAAGLVRYAEAMLTERRHSVLASGPIDPERIFAAAASGDEVALEAARYFAHCLGAGVVSVIHAYDPDVVVLGGGMMRASAQFLPQVRSYVDAHAWTLPPGRVPIVPAALEDAAALVGVAELAHGAELC